MSAAKGPAPAWRAALRALALLAIDPEGLRGMHLRARAGPVRHQAEGLLVRLPGAVLRRLPPDAPDTELFGGLDAAATLAAGRRVERGGILAQPARLILPMAERCRPALAARLAQMLDASNAHMLILLDEGAEPDECAPAPLTERLAFAVDLDGVRHDQAPPLLPAPADLARARADLPGITSNPADMATLAQAARALGIDSLRAPLLALRAARANAALEGHDSIAPADLRLAAELVLAPRATQLPADPAPQEDPPPEPPARDDADGGGEAQDPDSDATPPEILVAAVAAALPRDALDRLAANAGRARVQSGSGAGAARKGLTRGRPLPARPGRPDGRARIDVIATLRAAAPWQRLRRDARPEDRPDDTSIRVIVTRDDLRLRRYEEHAARLLILGVDASGSAAMARLAEAKGAVELLLAQAYARRDQVALIAFRGTGAQVILPPTRALARAKRLLAGLPGGGGTPLADALRAALAMARQAQGKGLTPALALLTDGRANVSLDGTGDRATAGADAGRMSALWRATGHAALVIDSAPRPGPETAQLAGQMGARHLPLPRADAHAISGAVQGALQDRG